MAKPTGGRMFKQGLIIMAAVALLLPAPAAALQPSATYNILWGHGNADDGEIIWMNPDKADPSATDTANGPGYCPPPFDVDAAGCTAAGQARPTGDFDTTFTLNMDPGLGTAIEFDETGVVSFVIYLGGSSGSCEGDMDISLDAGATNVASAADVPVSFTNGYVKHTAEVAPAVTSIDGSANLVWTITVTCTGTGLFLGVHDELGKSHITLPIPSAEPEPEPEPEPTGNETTNETAPEGNETNTQGNGTAGNQTNNPTNNGGDGTDLPEGHDESDDNHDEPAKKKGLPGPALPLLVAGLAIIALRRR